VVHVESSLTRPASNHTPDVSNHTKSTGVPLALAQVAEVANVLGIALVAPDNMPVAHHSLMGLPASTFSDVTRRVKDSLDTFESIESSAGQALALYFESATVLMRWVESHALVVIGTEQVHPTVLSVSVNAAAAKLQNLAKQAGGAAVAFRSTISSLPDSEFGEVSATGIVTRPSGNDPVPDATITRLTNLFAKPLGAVGRLAIQQRLKSGKPTIAGYPDFVQRMATLLEDAAEREAFVEEALRLVPQLEPLSPPPAISKAPAMTSALPATQRIVPPLSPQPLVPPVAPPAAQRAAMSGAPAPRPPAPTPGAAPAPAPEQPSRPDAAAPGAKPKKFVMYRGRKIEVDE